MTLNPRLRLAMVLSPPIIWTILFMFVPYTILLVYSFWKAQFPLFIPAFQFGNYIELTTDPQYGRVLLRTLKIACLVNFFVFLLAYSFAYFLVFKVRTTATRTALYMSVVAPLWVSYLLRAYTWKTILGT
ncbi:hypothetical protein [Breoghania sp.]|uniref:hypothetical protein n=1 Tax=Breoghania sp. TaxID=2065378 RepID=UPI002636939C|nr:hypothetical protein [Breoghania sp.]MDJ0933400.1 hypothetical protein [Breoghania sp.]